MTNYYPYPMTIHEGNFITSADSQILENEVFRYRLIVKFNKWEVSEINEGSLIFTIERFHKKGYDTDWHPVFHYESCQGDWRDFDVVERRVFELIELARDQQYIPSIQHDAMLADWKSDMKRRREEVAEWLQNVCTQKNVDFIKRVHERADGVEREPQESSQPLLFT